MTGVSFWYAARRRGRQPTAGRRERVSRRRSCATGRGRPRAGTRGRPVGQLALEVGVQPGGRRPDAAADALGLEVAGHAGVQRRRHVGMCAFDGADDGPHPGGPLDALAEASSVREWVAEKFGKAPAGGRSWP